MRPVLYVAVSVFFLTLTVVPEVWAQTTAPVTVSPGTAGVGVGMIAGWIFARIARE